MPTRTATAARGRPWTILVVAAAVAVLAVWVGGALVGDLRSGGFDDPGSESARARALVERAAGVSPSNAVAVLVTPGGDVRTGPGRALVRRVAATVGGDPGVGLVIAPGAGDGDRQISRDGRSAYVVGLLRPGDGASRAATVDRLRDRVAGDPRLAVGGPAVIATAITDRIRADLTRAELIALPAVFLLSVWVFRGLVAALLMPLMGGIAIAVTFAGIGLAGQVTDVSVFSTNLVVALGLGLAVDYSLLIVSRYREELARHGPGAAALRATRATAGRSVAVSAATIAASMGGLMLFPVDFLFSMGLGGVLAAVTAGTVALVVLPAALAVLGPRVEAGAPRRWRSRPRTGAPSEAGAWYRLSAVVTRRAGRVAVVTAAVLVVVASPVAGIGVTAIDADVLPAGDPARAVTDAVAAGFPRDLGDAVLVVAEADASEASRAAVARLAGRYRALPGVAEVTRPVHLGGGTWLTRVVPRDAALTDGARDVVRDVRAMDAPVPVVAGGPTARFVDQRAAILGALPYAVAAIIAVTLVALFLMTGSVAIPVKVVALNVLSIAATLGVLVWVFQHGHGQDLLGFESRGAIGLTQPVLLGAVAFGLSTDYTVFLLSRIREARSAGAQNAEAVAIGLQRTGRLITSAALLFAVAMAAFALSDIVLLKEIGVGAAVAVLIDASIVRALLVPSLMGLLGERNWWAPAPLRRAHARLGAGGR